METLSFARGGVIADDALHPTLTKVQGTSELQLLPVTLVLETSLGSQWESWWQEEEMWSPEALPSSLLMRGWPNGISVCPKTG